MAQRRYVLVLLIIMVISFALLTKLPERVGIEEEAESQQPVTETSEPVVEVVKNVGPATVKIQTAREVVIDRFFFQQLERVEGVGSGVIFTPDGYVMTNDHVVADANEIVVWLPDGRNFQGQVVGRDPLSDLAILKIESKDELPVASFYEGNDLAVGQIAIAIGNPLGQDYSVTTGVISALDRDILVDPENNRYLLGMIQTDAAINPGNSGGPLINQDGQVIGINTAIIQQAQGIGFAIPATTARLIASQIIEHGRPIRLGVLGGTLTPALASALREQTGMVIAVDSGAFITRVLPNSNAEAGGLAIGDIIVKMNETEISGMRQLQEEVQKIGYGGEIRLQVYRGSELIEVFLVLS
ncbi:MAG: trypsin-like serine protease [Firmicutes bacterium]|nr:trypsin-like serine protease [Bacillota bacterium]